MSSKSAANRQQLLPPIPAPVIPSPQVTFHERGDELNGRTAVRCVYVPEPGGPEFTGFGYWNWEAGASARRTAQREAVMGMLRAVSRENSTRAFNRCLDEILGDILNDPYDARPPHGPPTEPLPPDAPGAPKG